MLFEADYFHINFELWMIVLCGEHSLVGTLAGTAHSLNCNAGFLLMGSVSVRKPTFSCGPKAKNTLVNSLVCEVGFYSFITVTKHGVFVTKDVHPSCPAMSVFQRFLLLTPKTREGPCTQPTSMCFRLCPVMQVM